MTQLPASLTAKRPGLTPSPTLVFEYVTTFTLYSIMTETENYLFAMDFKPYQNTAAE